MRTPSLSRSRILGGCVAMLCIGLTACGSKDSTSSGAGTATTTAKDSALAALVPDDIRRNGLHVGTEATYPPFEFMGPDRQVNGIDADLAAALAKLWGVRVQFVNTSFDGLIPALLAKRFDAIFAGIEDNAERRRQLEFVDYFLDDERAVLVTKGNPGGIHAAADLCGRKVAAQTGDALVPVIREISADCSRPIALLTFPTASAAQLAVASGRADAYLTTLPQAAYVAKSAGGGQLEAVPVSTKAYEKGHIIGGIAVRKGDEALRTAILKGLERLRADGSYQAILDRWGVGRIALDRFTINAGS